MNHRWLVALFVLTISNAYAQPPTPTDNRLVMELVAKEPDVVTPTGIAVDGQVRIWVIENNTHQRPTNYKGHDSDRIRIFSDAGTDGKFRKIAAIGLGEKQNVLIDQ